MGGDSGGDRGTTDGAVSEEDKRSQRQGIHARHAAGRGGKHG